MFLRVKGMREYLARGEQIIDSCDYRGGTLHFSDRRVMDINRSGTNFFDIDYRHIVTIEWNMDDKIFYLALSIIFLFLGLINVLFNKLATIPYQIDFILAFGALLFFFNSRVRKLFFHTSDGKTRGYENISKDEFMMISRLVRLVK
jgi:hypothetical protein